MKKLAFLFLSIFLIQNSFANSKNPIASPTFDDVIKVVIGNDKFVFDDENIKVKVPNFANNPVQVPIFVDGKKIKNAQKLIVFADLNPVPKLIEMDLKDGLLPLISINMRVAQETPLRALVLDDKNIWHIGSKNIASFGGGCSVASEASSNTDFEKLLGKTSGNLFLNDGFIRIKTTILHPMETGLVFGKNEFYIKNIEIKADEKNLGDISVFPAVSENPRFIFETNQKAQNYSFTYTDTDSNEFEQSVKSDIK